MSDNGDVRQFNVTLPVCVVAMLARLAEENKRTMTAQLQLLIEGADNRAQRAAARANRSRSALRLEDGRIARGRRRRKVAKSGGAVGSSRGS